MAHKTTHKELHIKRLIRRSRYNKPWTRCGPFLLGVMLACYQSQRSNKAGHLPAPSTIAVIFGCLRC